MAPNLTFSASPGTPPANVAAPRQASTAPVTDQVINRGSADDLEKVSGIGKRRAARIVAFRDSAGPISSAAQLAQVLGISLALAEALWKAARQ